jgi:hypothetical protein
MRSSLQVWGGRILSALPVLAMGFSATMKFLRPPAVVEGFAHFGYQENVIVILGVVEVLCALIYIVPRTSFVGAILVTGYLGGATATHVRIGDPSFIGPVLLGVVAWGGLFLRDPRVRALVTNSAQISDNK